MTTTKRRGIFPLHALAAATALGCATQASAVSFNIGEIEGQFDSSLSVGASWSMRSADKDYIGTRNGGHASSQTSDDGRLNFKKGETFSKSSRASTISNSSTATPARSSVASTGTTSS